MALPNAYAPLSASMIMVEANESSDSTAFLITPIKSFATFLITLLPVSKNSKSGEHIPFPNRLSVVLSRSLDLGEHSLSSKVSQTAEFVYFGISHSQGFVKVLHGSQMFRHCRKFPYGLPRIPEVYEGTPSASWLAPTSRRSGPVLAMV